MVYSDGGELCFQPEWLVLLLQQLQRRRSLQVVWHSARRTNSVRLSNTKQKKNQENKRISRVTRVCVDSMLYYLYAISFVSCTGKRKKLRRFLVLTVVLSAAAAAAIKQSLRLSAVSCIILTKNDKMFKKNRIVRRERCNIYRVRRLRCERKWRN